MSSRGRGRSRARGAALAAIGVLLLSVGSACGPDLTEEEACAAAEEYLLRPKTSGWQYLDQTRFPPSGFRNVEVMECSDFRSKVDQGWASVRIQARGDEFDADEERFLGRIIFTAEIELDRTEGGWVVLEKHKF